MNSQVSTDVRPWAVFRDHPDEPDIAYIRPEGTRIYEAEIAVLYNANIKYAPLLAAAQELLALAKQYASECAGCSGHGFTVGDDGISGRGPDDVEPTRYACEDCADIRAVIAKAEGRS